MQEKEKKVMENTYYSYLNRTFCAASGSKDHIGCSSFTTCRGLSDDIEDYSDCLDQLSEIVVKYNDSHNIVLGGDMNEDMVLRDQQLEPSS